MGAKADPSDMHAHPQRRRSSDDNCSTILGGLLSLVILVFLYRWIGSSFFNTATLQPCTQTDLLYEHTQRITIDMTGSEGTTINIEKNGDEQEDGSLLDGISNQLIQLSTLPHKLLPTPDPDSSRLIIIGDVHGQLHELQKLLKAAGFSRKRGDHVVFTGDMISKGPDSPGVVDFAMEIGASGVRGNHEDRVLTAWRKMHKHRTLDALTLDDEVEEEAGEEDGDVNASSKKKADRAVAQSLTPAQRKWLSHLPVILKVGHIPFHGEVVVVHAGLVPYIPLEDQDPDAVMNMRTLLFEKDRSASPTGKHKKDHHHEKNRIATPSEGREGKSWSKVWNKVQEDLPEKKRMTVVYGHDAKTGLNVQEYTFGLDSGCVRGKELTALVFAPDGKGGIKHEIVSVDCEKPKKDKKKKKHHKAKADGVDGEDGVEEEDGEDVRDEMR